MFKWFFNLFHNTPAPAPAPISTLPLPELIEEVFNEINAVRIMRGHTMLVHSTGPSIAQNWAESMAEKRTLDHGDFSRRVWAKYPNSYDSEDVEMNTYRHASDVVEQWMNSPEHRENLLKPADILDLGCAIGTDGYNYWVADIIKL